MTHVHEQASYELGADEMWERVGDFHAIADWHPAIASQTSDGGPKVRELSLADGATIVETLVEAGDRSYTYRIDESPLPVRDYTAMIAVSDNAGGCTVDWTADFEPEGASEAVAKETISGIFTSGLGAL